MSSIIVAIFYRVVAWVAAWGCETCMNMPLIGAEELPAGNLIPSEGGTVSLGGGPIRPRLCRLPAIPHGSKDTKRGLFGHGCDNMELGRHGKKGPKPSRRAVPDLLSWVTCFWIYASIVRKGNPRG